MPEPTAHAPDDTEQLAEALSRVTAHLYSLNADELAVVELVVLGLVRARTTAAAESDSYDALVSFAATFTELLRKARR